KLERPVVCKSADPAGGLDGISWCQEKLGQRQRTPKGKSSRFRGESGSLRRCSRKGWPGGDDRHRPWGTGADTMSLLQKGACLTLGAHAAPNTAPTGARIPLSVPPRE
ncbi:hypothetical protein P7K49_005974, partial [Saguinus oedipus]